MPEPQPERTPGVQERSYGVTGSGRPVREFVLGNAHGASVRILEYGGIVSEIRVPDRDGLLANVVLGRPSLAAYEARNPYFGALIGRYANRIGGGTFVLDGSTHRLTSNDGLNHLHGGAHGFDKQVWKAVASRHPDGPAVTLEYVSPAGEEGYPGRLATTATYVLTAQSALRVSFRATTDAPTIVNLTSHSYFNLAGESSGSVADHRLTVVADAYTPVDEMLIPTGEIAPVDGTPFDLRRGVLLGHPMRASHPQLDRAGGIDHNFVLSGPDRARRGDAADLRLAARLVDPGSGRTLEVHTIEPGLQVYTGNALDGTLMGTSGRAYQRGAGVALETQNFPDAPNHRGFPDPVLRPGEIYESVTELRFGIGG